MAERWQQWMPLHIDRWRGSPDVRAMHPAARMGYLELLCSCWQSPDCSIENDPLELATLSGLGDELWALYAPRIMRKFVLVNGRLRNEVLFAEWEDSLRVYEKRRSGAVRTNSSRSAPDDRTESERPADTQTVTGTETTTGTETKAKTLASTAVAVPADRGKLLGTLPCTGGFNYEVREDDLARDGPLYPAVDVRQAYRDMKGWLLADPRRQKTKTGIRRFMASWLARAQNEGKSNSGGMNAKPANGRVNADDLIAHRQGFLERLDAKRMAAEQDHGGRPVETGFSGSERSRDGTPLALVHGNVA